MQPEERLFIGFAIWTLKDSSKPSTDFHWHMSELIITMSTLSATLSVTKSFSREGWAGRRKSNDQKVSGKFQWGAGNIRVITNYFIKTSISPMPSSTCALWWNMQYKNAHQTPLIDLTRIMCMCFLYSGDHLKQSKDKVCTTKTDQYDQTSLVRPAPPLHFGWPAISKRGKSPPNSIWQAPFNIHFALHTGCLKKALL